MLSDYYGPTHPNIARTLAYLSEARFNLGSHDVAVRLLARAHEIDNQLFGESHPLTQRLRNRLLQMQKAQGST